MKTFAIVGLGKFSRHLVDELKTIDCQLVIIDQDESSIEEYESIAFESYIVEKITRDNLRRMLPESLDAVIIDFENSLELAALVTHYTKGLEVTKSIYVRAENDDQREILINLGATDVISPSRDAAQKLKPLLTSPLLFTYNAIGQGMAVAELRVPSMYVKKTIIESDLRRERGINVVAVRRFPLTTYEFLAGDYELQDKDLMMISGKEEDVQNFCESFGNETRYARDFAVSSEQRKHVLRSWASFFGFKRKKK